MTLYGHVSYARDMNGVYEVVGAPDIEYWLEGGEFDWTELFNMLRKSNFKEDTIIRRKEDGQHFRIVTESSKHINKSFQKAVPVS